MTSDSPAGRQSAYPVIDGLMNEITRLRQERDNAVERIRLARHAILLDGYFRPDQVGDDIAPRIVERLSAMRTETVCGYMHYHKLAGESGYEVCETLQEKLGTGAGDD